MYNNKFYLLLILGLLVLPLFSQDKDDLKIRAKEFYNSYVTDEMINENLYVQNLDVSYNDTNENLKMVNWFSPKDPLFYAVLDQDLFSFKEIITNEQIDINKKYIYGDEDRGTVYYLIELCTLYNFEEGFDYLMDSGVDTKGRTGDILEAAAISGSVSMIKKVMQTWNNIRAYYYEQTLPYLLIFNHKDLFKEFYSKYNFKYEKYSKLKYAFEIIVETKDYELIDYIIKRSTNDIDNLFESAATRGQTEVMRYLKEQGANFGSAFDIAIYSGQINVLKELYDLGFDPNTATTYYGLFPYERLDRDFNIPAIILTLANGGEIPTKYYGSFINNALNQNEQEFVEFLLNGYFDKDRLLSSSSFVLYSLAYNNDLEDMRYLLDKGFDVNYVNKNSETCLHLAAKKNNSEMAELLLEYGIDTTLTNTDGYTALDIANQNGNTNFSSLIKGAM